MAIVDVPYGHLILFVVLSILISVLVIWFIDRSG